MVRAMPADPPDWPVSDPFVANRIAGRADIDGFGHVNNVRYIQWAMDHAWAHSEALGLTMDDYRCLGAGCIVWRHEFDYAAPVLEGETVALATWIDANDGRLRLTRGFAFRRIADGRIVFRGRTTFVTVEMASGRPCRMPPAFVDAYRPAKQRKEKE